MWVKSSGGRSRILNLSLDVSVDIFINNKVSNGGQGVLSLQDELKNEVEVAFATSFLTQK
jgi:hypothetical protein